MKRKLFSAILFGALLTASTSGLTSCKDYDDDISNLQSQIDKLATKEELATKASELSTAISNAQSAADAAKKVAEDAAAAAKAAATKDDVEAAKKAAIEAGQAAADKAQKAADAAQAAADKNAEDLKKAADGAQKAVEEIQTAMEGLATTEAVNAAVKVVADKYDAQAKELKALSDRLDKVEAKLGLGEGGEDIDLTEIQAELDDIEDALDLLVGSYSTMITSISVFCSGDDWTGMSDIGGWTGTGYPSYVATKELAFTETTEKADIAFPVKDNITDKKYNFTAGWKLDDEASLIVRVTPATANLEAKNVRLIDSQGKDLSNLMSCSKVEPFTGLLSTSTTRATYPTGLYKVTYKLNSGWTASAFKAAKETYVKNEGTKNILYAVAVANSDSLVNEDRLVASEWNVVLNTKEAETPSQLTVDGVKINSIKNRYGEAAGETDYVWNNSTLSMNDNNLFGDVAVAMTDNPSSNYRPADDRHSKSVLKVQENKDIEIKFNKDIKGFYVELDYRFRERNSNPSEIVAWNSYGYDKVGKYDINGNCIQKATMIDGNKGTIKITNVGDGKYDVIGFRVFAVNLDGTLLDPDGVAFYVGVGDEVSTDTYDATVNLQDGNKIAWVPVTGFLKGATINYSRWTADSENPKYGGSTESGSTASNPLTVTYWKSDKRTQVSDFINQGDQIAYMKVEMTTPGNYVDGATYKQTMTISKTEGTETYVQKVITLNVTKKMPETFPTAFGFLAGQPNVNGVFDAYIVPGTTALNSLKANYAQKNQTSGYYALGNVFNIPNLSSYGTYAFTVKGAATKNNLDGTTTDGGADINSFTGAKYEFTVESKYIKDVTYPIEAKFNYTAISTRWDASANSGAGAWKTSVDYPVKYTGNLGITMKCWHEANTLAWSTVPSIKWVADPVTSGVINYVDLTTLTVTNSYDNAFFGGNFAKLLNNEWLSDGSTSGSPSIVSAKLSSGNTSYFDVTVEANHPFYVGDDADGNPQYVHHTALKFTQKQNTSRPNVHDETLEIKTKDAYNHEVKNTITVQVAPAE